MPHGTPYRETFLLSGFLVMAAWVCLAARPGTAPLLTGAILPAGLMVASLFARPGLTGHALAAASVSAAVTLGAVLLLRLRTPVGQVASQALLTVTVTATAVYAAFGVLGFPLWSIPSPPSVVDGTARAAVPELRGTTPESIWALQERLLGAKVYHERPLIHAAGPEPRQVPRGWELPPSPTAAI